jgi:hypothetical protein
VALTFNKNVLKIKKNTAFHLVWKIMKSESILESIGSELVKDTLALLNRNINIIKEFLN